MGRNKAFIVRQELVMPRKDFDRAEIELQKLERELIEVLQTLLVEVSSGQKPQCFNCKEFNPHGLGSSLFWPESSKLLELSQKTIELRELLSLPIDGCPAQLLISAFEEYSNLENAHRLGPRRLADRLLSDLKSFQSTVA
jgi:hypothetical protein